MRLGPGELPVLDRVGVGLERLALLLAVAVDERVGQDPVQPGLEVGALGELVEGGERLDERLLDEILGVGRVAGHPHRRRVELIEEGQRVALEPSPALLGGLFPRSARGRLVGCHPALSEHLDCGLVSLPAFTISGISDGR